MKRTVLIFLVVAFVLAAFAYDLRPAVSVPQDLFRAEFGGILHRHGYVMTEQRSAGLSRLALPWRIWLRQPGKRDEGGINLPAGLHDSVECYALARRDAPEFHCFVRYLDSQASVIAIRSPVALQPAAMELCFALMKRFPETPIQLGLE